MEDAAIAIVIASVVDVIANVVTVVIWITVQE